MEETTIRRATFSEEDDDDDDGYFVVGLAEQADGGGGGSLVITLGFEHDDQDCALGMDTYCLSTDDGVTHYGGVKGWGLRARELAIQLDQETSALFGVDGGWRLHLDVDDASVRSLEEGLTRVLVGVPRDDNLANVESPS